MNELNPLGSIAELTAEARDSINSTVENQLLADF